MLKFTRRILPVLIIAIPLHLNANDQEHEQHEAHEHGAAQLNLVQEKQSILMELHLSGMDVLGFEHPPSSPQEQAAVTQAEQKLSDTNTLFVLDSGAGCQVRSAHAQRIAVEHEAEHHEEHAEHEAEHDEHKDENHSEFQAKYAFECTQVNALKRIKTNLFTLFPSLQKIQAQIVTERGQTAHSLSASQPDIELP